MGCSSELHFLVRVEGKSNNSMALRVRLLLDRKPDLAGNHESFNRELRVCNERIVIHPNDIPAKITRPSTEVSCKDPWRRVPHEAARLVAVCRSLQ